MVVITDDVVLDCAICVTCALLELCIISTSTPYYIIIPDCVVMMGVVW